jgi:hypothetical protein
VFESSPVILLIKRYRTIGVFVLLALTLAVSPPRIRDYGHNLQIAVPLIGWACAATNGQAIDYFVRQCCTDQSTNGTRPFPRVSSTNDFELRAPKFGHFVENDAGNPDFRLLV